MEYITNKNKIAINKIVKDFSLDYLGLENLTYDLFVYLKMCRKENKLVVFDTIIKDDTEK